MNDQTIELLNYMADKFGTTVEHLWGVLIKQSIICATIESIVALAFIISCVLVFRFVKTKTTERKTAPNQYPEWEGEEAFVAWAITAIAILITVFQIYSAIDTTLTVILNPEYWALKQLLSK